jgi:predicted P-loop ATPase
MLTSDGAGGVREWGEPDDINLTLYMQRDIGLSKMDRGTVAQAVKLTAYRDVRNCARDHVESFEWDGTRRLEHFFVDIFGSEDTAYTQAAGRNFWLSMMARVFQPGCQVDNMVVLEGTQGKGKSSALQVIGGEWYAAQHESAMNPRAFAEVLQGKMLVEIEEMDAFSRAETNSVKKAVSVRSDRFRPSGAHGYAKDHPRRCIFAGSTNRDDWNKDETGARRFWPVRCTTVEIDLLERQRGLYFAEAVARFKAGETWWEMPEDETKAEQQARYDADPWQGPIARFVAQLPAVTVEEVMTECLKIELAKRTRAEQMRVGAVLRVLGWMQKDERRGNRVVKVWRPMGRVAAFPTQQTEVATSGRDTQVLDSLINF